MNKKSFIVLLLLLLLGVFSLVACESQSPAEKRFWEYGGYPEKPTGEPMVTYEVTSGDVLDNELDPLYGHHVMGTAYLFTYFNELGCEQHPNTLEVYEEEGNLVFWTECPVVKEAECHSTFSPGLNMDFEGAGRMDCERSIHIMYTNTENIPEQDEVINYSLSKGEQTNELVSYSFDYSPYDMVVGVIQGVQP